MQYRLRSLQLFIAIVLAIALLGSLCPAQDGWGNGQGYSATSPVAATPANNLTGSAVPGPPAQPTTASSPSSWPGHAQPAASPWPAPPSAVPTSEMTPCKGVGIIGRVGLEAILESEVAGAVNETLSANKDRISPDQLDDARAMLTQKHLREVMQTKLVYLDAKRSIPAEGMSNFEKQVTKVFEESELEKMVKKAGVDSAQELDQKLRSLGTSLEREKRSFTERTLAREWIRQQVKPDEETTYDQMVVYYREHLKEFTTPTRAQWEELMVSYSKYPTKAAAFNAIASMGNQVFNGAPFAEVAKSGDGITAAKGGGRDWTTQGALSCQALDQALFSLPEGQLSPIIQGPTGYHIIRVTKREAEVVRPFLEAQVDIKKKIVDQRSQKLFREYMDKLQARTPIWTIYDTPQMSNRQSPTSSQPLRR